MADHLDAPGLTPPLGDVKTDITDVYAFRKPNQEEGNNHQGGGDDDEGGATSILALNVNPLTLANAFETGATAEYLLHVDTDADFKPDITFRTTFANTEDGQTATVQRIADGHTKVVVAHAPVSFGSDPIVTRHGPYRLFAGRRSDPFFFDLLGFLNNFQFTGSDFFATRNVFSIVLEVPNRALGHRPKATSIWGRTRITLGGALVNDDRMGRAAINTVFNHGQDKNIFNNTDPAQDRSALTQDGVTTYMQSFTNTLVTLSHLGGHSGYTQAEALGIAQVLLPDVLGYDFSKPTSYAALNGRRLQDDVIDISLNLVTKGLLTSDGVGPHTDYLDHFPYMGTPH